ncbi:hypothetical protein [Arthrobacter sp. efr-133-TYG-118]|uniref:hypothetical protein n=1 Tax=Arthrobacter sp. efr-133-TYG-118 TaxID=3040279 RepID=UPI00254E73E2|nr:hypothetical protein [Arthrobacter sp. efr-133-TYG-118]
MYGEWVTMIFWLPALLRRSAAVRWLVGRELLVELIKEGLQAVLAGAEVCGCQECAGPPSLMRRALPSSSASRRPQADGGSALVHGRSPQKHRRIDTASSSSGSGSTTIWTQRYSLTWSSAMLISDGKRRRLSSVNPDHQALTTRGCSWSRRSLHSRNAAKGDSPGLTPRSSEELDSSHRASVPSR